MRSPHHSAPATRAHRLRGRRRRRRLWWTYSLLAFFTPLLSAKATSVTPPSFPQLVAEADVIAEGSVTAIDSRWVDGPQGPMINTFVTFAVRKQLKGAAAKALTLQFLGGTVGNDTLQVAGMPQFTVGKTDILFIRGNGVQFCPLVRLMHGRYHVHTDAAARRRYVTRDDETPLTSVNDVQIPAGEPPPGRARRSGSSALAPEDFESRIAAEVARQN